MRQVIAAFFALLFCSAPPAWAADDPIARVLAGSGLAEDFVAWASLAQAEVELRKSAMPPQEYARTSAVMRAAFDPAALRTDAEDLLRRHYGEARLRAWEGWLSDPRRRRMATLEAASNAARSSAAPLPAARRRLLERLDAAAGTTEAALDAQQAVSRALLVAVEPGIPANRRLTPERLEAVMRELKIRMQPALSETVLATGAQAYRRASEEELQAFVMLHESRTGTWVRGVARELRRAVLARAVLRARREAARSGAERG